MDESETRLGFQLLRNHFVRDLASFPSTVSKDAERYADQMINAWIKAGFSYSRMMEDFKANPDYPLDEKHELVRLRQDWYSLLLQSGIDTIEPHLLIVSTLPHFQKLVDTSVSMTAIREIEQEEFRRMEKADKESIFVRVMNIKELNREILYEKYSELAVVAKTGNTDVLKLVPFETMMTNLRDRLSKDRGFEILDNSKFNWRRELFKKRDEKCLHVKNLYVSSIETAKMILTKNFPKAINIWVDIDRAFGLVTFKSFADSLAAFQRSASLRVENGPVVVIFKRLM